MRVLVTFAVEAEFAPWRRRHGFSLVKRQPWSLYQAKIGALDVFSLLTGIGEPFGTPLMSELMEGLDSEGFTFCISSGLAGSLRAEHRLGEILVPQELKATSVHADIRSDLIACDSALVQLAGACGAKTVGRFLTADRVLVSAAEKSAVCGLADAVEMESFGIVKEAHAWGCRPVAVRAISDAVAEDLPVDFNRTLSEKGTVRISGILSELRRRPQALAALIRFGQQSRNAAVSLADFLDRYIEALARQSAPSRFEEVAAT